MLGLLRSHCNFKYSNLTLEADPHKFLGAVMTDLNTAQDHLKFLLDKLNMKLNNLNNSKVRGENKVAVFDRYLVLSMRLHLTVHTVHKTHLEQLDQPARKFLKEWLGIPPRGCTSLGIFSPSLLGTKLIYISKK